MPADGSQPQPRPLPVESDYEAGEVAPARAPRTRAGAAALLAAAAALVLLAVAGRGGPSSGAASLASPEAVIVAQDEGMSTCVETGESCAMSKCCSEPGARCYKKLESGSSWCNQTCDPYYEYSVEDGAWVKRSVPVWDCEDITIASTANTVVSGADSPPRLLDTPVVMTHDAATGYFGDVFGSTICQVYQTQYIDLWGQLSCGARALDLRVAFRVDLLYPGVWNYYHGNYGFLSIGNWYASDQTLEGTMGEVKAFAKDHPDELVVLYWSHCQNAAGGAMGCMDVPEGGYADDTLLKQMEKNGIPMITNCTAHESMTRAEAMELAKIGDGSEGHVLATFDCMNDNNDVYENVAAGMFGDMESITNEVLDGTKGKKKGFWEIQAIWQLTPSYSNGYSTLGANTQDNLNGWFTEKFAEKAKSNGGVWAIDNMCHNGLEFARAMGTQITAADEASCKEKCNSAPNKCDAHKECAIRTDANGCCLCVQNQSNIYDCCKHNTILNPCDLPGGSCDVEPCIQDCIACPEWGWKC